MYGILRRLPVAVGVGLVFETAAGRCGDGDGCFARAFRAARGRVGPGAGPGLVRLRR